MNLRKLWSVLVDGNLRRYYFQRRLKGESRRDPFARRWARKIGRREFGASTRLAPDRIEPLSRQLSTDGYARLGTILSPGDVRSVKDAIRGALCFDAYDHRGGARFALDQTPPSCNTAYYDWRDFVRIPALMSAANDPGILGVAQNFLGGAPTISDMKMWWSLLRDGGKENQLFHRDVDDYRFCKLFVYLTDVGPEGGPHVYVPGSSGSRECLEDRRYSDEEVERHHGNKAVSLCAEAGSAFLVNTYGLHKGLAPKSSERMIFVVQYSLLPIGLVTYEPVACDVKGYEKFDPYVNRLFLRPATSGRGDPAGK